MPNTTPEALNRRIERDSLRIIATATKNALAALSGGKRHVLANALTVIQGQLDTLNRMADIEAGKDVAREVPSEERATGSARSTRARGHGDF